MLPFSCLLFSSINSTLVTLDQLIEIGRNTDVATLEPVLDRLVEKSKEDFAAERAELLLLDASQQLVAELSFAGISEQQMIHVIIQRANMFLPLIQQWKLEAEASRAAQPWIEDSASLDVSTRLRAALDRIRTPEERKFGAAQSILGEFLMYQIKRDHPENVKYLLWALTRNCF
jgi:hypothetical protein